VSLVMFLREVRSLRWTAGWYALGLFLYALMIMSLYPAMHANSAMLQGYIQSLPSSIIRAFGVDDIASLSGFLGTEILNFMWPLIVAVFIITAGSGMVAGEIERGTSELWLSVPESRARLLTAKLAALLVGVAALIAATVLALCLGAAIEDVSLSYAAVAAMAASMLALTVAMGGYTVLCSALTSGRGSAAGIAAGLTLVGYMFWVIGGIGDRWSWLKRLSIFSAYQPQHALKDGSIPILETGLLLLVGVVASVVAVVVFQRRDAA